MRMDNSDKPVYGSQKPVCGSYNILCGSRKPVCGSNKPVRGIRQPVCGSCRLALSSVLVEKPMKQCLKHIQQYSVGKQRQNIASTLSEKSSDFRQSLHGFCYFFVTFHFIAYYVTHLAQGELTSFIAHRLTQWGPDCSKINESQGSFTQTSTVTELLAKKGIEYAINMIAMTRWRMKLLFDAEIQVMLAESPFTTSTFSVDNKDLRSMMKYLCRRILDYDTKAARREDQEDLFIQNEKRSHETKDIKPFQSLKRTRCEDGEHIQKMVIDLEHVVRDEGWEEPFQGFPKRLNKPLRQHGARQRRMNNSQQGQRTHDRSHWNPEKEMTEILSQKSGEASISIQAAGKFRQSIFVQRPGQIQICWIGLESNNSKRQNKARTG
ncbi:MAG: hypothetical protein EZS28_017372 [Streblomastix strix]|uniref:Uncharacterized protein n=1 Tax=Streblomastix strix TaxID=222440 RepID=A0A5J4VXN6_9EUKA|nr:MAG: hypothetical protein EZS28_017372 [Streblomastix strix]